VPAIADAAQHALVAQQQVLRTVAHDLRSPLTGIMGGCEFLTTELPGPLTTDQHEVVEQLYRTSQLMHRLVNDLLDASGSAQPTLSITTKRLDPCVVAQQAHAMCRDAATARGLRCEFHRPATIPTILSDHDRLLQILLNLLRNAVQYTTTGGVVLRVGTYDEHVEFRVDDTGPGIDPAVQAAMWQEFQRATSEGNGYGLGLAIVQRLVKALGGTVGVDSVPGEGSSFWVRFPCEAPAS
jgi:signal transduction histidine kinase